MHMGDGVYRICYAWKIVHMGDDAHGGWCMGRAGEGMVCMGVWCTGRDSEHKSVCCTGMVLQIFLKFYSHNTGTFH